MLNIQIKFYVTRTQCIVQLRNYDKMGRHIVFSFDCLFVCLSVCLSCFCVRYVSFKP